MNLRRRSFGLLLFILFLLFMLIIIELLCGHALSSNLISIIGFVLTLIGIFGGAYFELNKFERQLKEDRKKEIRQHRLDVLDSIESWMNEVSASIEDIAALRELSPKDPQDGVLIVGQKKIKPIAERLLRLDYQGFLVFGRTADIIGIKKGVTQYEDLSAEHQALLKNVFAIWSFLTPARERLAADNVIPGISHFATPLAEARRAIDRIRQSYN